MSIIRPIAEHARRLPAQPALLFEGECTTRRELDIAVARLAAFIAGRTTRGADVAIDLANGPALALLFLATAAAGRTAQILDHDWPLTTAQNVIAALKPGLVMTSRLGLHEGAVGVPPDVSVGDIAQALGAPADPRRVPDPDPETLFYTGFTSGSTGLPKGFSRTHRSWIASFAGAQQEFEIGPQDCVCAPGPLSHSLPLYGLASALHAGAKFLLARSFQAHSALRAIVAQRVSVLYVVPTQLLTLLDAAEAEDVVCHTLRVALCSGSKCPDGLVARFRKVFPHAVFAEFYGASELSFVTLARSDEPVPDGSVGRPFPGVTITVRGANGKRLATGRTGLVYAESPLLFSRYAEGEGDVLRAGDAMSVGDRGYLDKDGYLYLTGRADRLVICSGRNIQPEEVEAHLIAHPAIAQAAVFGIEDGKRGERLVAMLRGAPDTELRAADISGHLRELLPAYKVPTRFATTASWPVTRLGKTDFAALRRMWLEEACEPLE